MIDVGRHHDRLTRTKLPLSPDMALTAIGVRVLKMFNF